MEHFTFLFTPNNEAIETSFDDCGTADKEEFAEICFFITCLGCGQKNQTKTIAAKGRITFQRVKKEIIFLSTTKHCS
jgi:hypothetical protein